MKIKLWFRIHGLEFCSWLIVWRHLMKAFIQNGVDVCESPFNVPADIKDRVELHWGDPAFWNWSGKESLLKAGYALSEHRSMLAPDKAIPNLQQCDVLICPCLSSAQAYFEAPLDIPIKIVPFGIDEEEMSYHKREWDGELKFLLIGATQFRKGSWLAVEAFRKAFDNSKNVSLTVASFKEYPMYEKLQMEYAKWNNIHFAGKVEDVRDYYHNHHVIVSPHLAEGWMLSLPEAMATGMPGLVSRCSAPREYFSTKYGWWIEMSDLYAPVDQCLVGVQGSWRLPDVDSLVDKFRYAVAHRDECEKKGKVASEYVLRNLTWKQSAEKVIKLLREEANENINDNAYLQ